MSMIDGSMIDGSSIDDMARTMASKIRRPPGVTILALFVLFFTCINILRLIESLENWNFLSSLPGVSPLYQAVTGAVWALVGFPVFYGLWWGLRWGPVSVQVASVAYSIYAWLNRFLLGKDPAVRNGNFSWPFLLAVNFIFLVFTFVIVSLPRARQFFQRLGEDNND